MLRLIGLSTIVVLPHYLHSPFCHRSIKGWLFHIRIHNALNHLLHIQESQTSLSFACMQSECTTSTCCSSFDWLSSPFATKLSIFQGRKLICSYTWEMRTNGNRGENANSIVWGLLFIKDNLDLTIARVEMDPTIFIVGSFSLRQNLAIIVNFVIKLPKDSLSSFST